MIMFTGDPFRGYFQVPQRSGIVRVTTVNYDGQTAVYRANFRESLRTFNITCSLDDGLLRCRSDSVTIPGRTLCQTDDRTPVMCE